ncbi:hypothetical protein [Clostridium sp.]|uniref:hypothetical protein n=1 Tax=Clostridium sp. TaxID=1506 RepID=UPI001D66024E|nr:hypothetical protein [Clostridium sp.]MBS5937138.1 hypothetical protein [Clostridium sp.]
MTREIYHCRECYSIYGVELHHIVFRSENKNLEKCKLNFAYLCQEHHRGTYGVHGSKGSRLNKKLKLEFQNQLGILWDKQYLTREEINEVLQISDKALNRLLKTLTLQKGLYVREEVIRQCMGGRLIVEEGVKSGKI